MNRQSEVAQSRLSAAADALTLLNPDLVEWTTYPLRDWGLQISAELTLTDSEAPFEQLAALLNQIAAEVLMLDVQLPRR
ncbi:MAG: hypothetical protein MPJ50_04365 [Pirellulales bacterium]|nr:hypothetical protein [Pirellulales bacterium]